MSFYIHFYSVDLHVYILDMVCQGAVSFDFKLATFWLSFVLYRSLEVHRPVFSVLPMLFWVFGPQIRVRKKHRSSLTCILPFPVLVTIDDTLVLSWVSFKWCNLSFDGVFVGAFLL